MLKKKLSMCKINEKSVVEIGFETGNLKKTGIRVREPDPTPGQKPGANEWSNRKLTFNFFFEAKWNLHNIQIGLIGISCDLKILFILISCAPYAPKVPGPFIFRQSLITFLKVWSDRAINLIFPSHDLIMVPFHVKILCFFSNLFKVKKIDFFPINT